MDRRELILGALASGLYTSPATANSDKWGKAAGYPSGMRSGLNRAPETRVGNYSGGYENLLPHNKIANGDGVFTLARQPADLSYRWGLFRKTPDEYMRSWPITGLLIARDKQILLESYGFERNESMRFTSWSMAKSVTSLLLGVALDQKLIGSYDDHASKYVPELEGTLHGSVTLRNLSNMSSGADVLHERDNHTIYPRALLGPHASIRETVKSWNARREEQGRTFNYNELSPLTLGMVLRQVSGKSLAQYCEDVLWKPLGAEAAATWMTDPEKNEFNCIGIGAILRDWARLGFLMADSGVANGTQIVSQSWIRECCSWGPQDKHTRFGYAGPNFGYKAHMWHANREGTRPFFNGHHGQRVIVDIPTKTVLVQTAVDHDGSWQPELFALFDAVTRM
ncbi:serine hydrolase domain-containing protein [Hydrogenophaga palleronii]|uniref:serine hydrolase domain-containing protein n=1 Tax=Hydrogenophaga palleronii TaxID=65655 RepID=UPI0009FDAD69|nr:serine hydrolase [Hydrogenophaga palleronii]